MQKCALMIGSMQCDRGAKELMQRIYSRESAVDTAAKIFKGNFIIVNLKAKEKFKAGAMHVTIKHMISFSNCSLCCMIVNLDITYSKCPRCCKDETQEHITQCKMLLAEHLRRKLD